MEPTTCSACGSDLPDPGARFCSACGAPVSGVVPVSDGDPESAPEDAVAADINLLPALATDGPEAPESGPEIVGTSSDLSKFALEVPLRHRLTEAQWQYAIWGAVVAGALAVVALVAVVFGLLSSSNETSRSPVAAAGESTTTTTVVRRTGMINEFPVAYPSIVESPQVGDSAGYHQDQAYIAFRLTVDTCERSEGMLRAGGSIRNETLIGQTLDYHIAVEMTRRVIGSSLASLETSVEDLGPRETAEWSVETVSTKTVNVACDVAALTVAPSEGS
jgi:hypothetical protein